MKILFLTPRFPYPLLKGDQTRAFHQLRILGQRHEIDLLALSSEPIPEASLKEVRPLVKRMQVFSHGRLRMVSGLVRNVFSGLPLQTAMHDNPAFRKLVTVWRGERAYDLVHLQTARMAWILKDLQGVPVVTDFIDALSMNMFNRYREDRSPARWVAKLEWKRMLRLERELISKSTRTLIVSERDANVFEGEIKPKPIHLGVRFPETQEVEPERAGLTFHGNMGYFPNTQAAEVLIKEIMPEIWKQHPELKLTLAGTNPPERLSKLTQGLPVYLTGFVDDILEVVRAGRVAVFPMRSGSGQQFKVLEALACRTPVVASSMAAEGVAGLKHGENVLIADDPKEFAACVENLLKNPQKAKAQAEKGFELVKQGYTWERSAEALEQLYQEAITKGQTRSPI